MEVNRNEFRRVLRTEIDPLLPAVNEWRAGDWQPESADTAELLHRLINAVTWTLHITVIEEVAVIAVNERPEIRAAIRNECTDTLRSWNTRSNNRIDALARDAFIGRLYRALENLLSGRPHESVTTAA